MSLISASVAINSLQVLSISSNLSNTSNLLFFNVEEDNIYSIILLNSSRNIILSFKLSNLFILCILSI
jgi:hypothetical protein